MVRPAMYYGIVAWSLGVPQKKHGAELHCPSSTLNVLVKKKCKILN